MPRVYYCSDAAPVRYILILQIIILSCLVPGLLERDKILGDQPSTHILQYYNREQRFSQPNLGLPVCTRRPVTELLPGSIRVRDLPYNPILKPLQFAQMDIGDKKPTRITLSWPARKREHLLASISCRLKTGDEG